MYCFCLCLHGVALSVWSGCELEVWGIIQFFVGKEISGLVVDSLHTLVGAIAAPFVDSLHTVVGAVAAPYVDSLHTVVGAVGTPYELGGGELL